MKDNKNNKGNKDQKLYEALRKNLRRRKQQVKKQKARNKEV